MRLEGGSDAKKRPMEGAMGWMIAPLRVDARVDGLFFFLCLLFGGGFTARGANGKGTCRETNLEMDGLGRWGDGGYSNGCFHLEKDMSR